jgi:methylenetetrahydrofolate--tRNA-(uracil-5-)-methyltransferase
MIPGLENANFVRYGVMHRNSFINSPGKLDVSFQARLLPGLYFAGQFTGVEGYVESAASGLVAGVNLAHTMLGKETVDFTRSTAIGALAHYVSEYPGKDFQPMNVNFGIMDELINPPRGKKERYEQVSERSLNVINEIIAKKM